ncbi:Glycosyl transferase family 2 [groundwater metagenome]|uniref:Glycosyl transferase family 2 n=1 Tax=groundwater metagenome TaxID=717931 RepID=A0A098EAS1_9ZZZZ
MKIAGVVVLYNSDETVIECIKSYIDEIEVLYLIDNSETKNDELLIKIKSFKKIVYIDNKGNQGISMALNIGARLAIQEGYDWLLTMDQDSKFLSDKSIYKMIQAIPIYKKLAIICPFCVRSTIKFDNVINKSNFSIVPGAITSGNLLNLKVYQEIGVFNEDYFIDYVDTDFCIRAMFNGYIIVRCNSAILEHHIGDTKKQIIGFTTNHSPIRKYYIMRNALYTMSFYKNIYSDIFGIQKYIFFAEIIKIILYEKQKIRKLLMMWRGYKDFKKGIKGKYKK